MLEKLGFNEEVLNLKAVVFLKAITEANIICLSTLLHIFVMMQFKHILMHTKVQHQLRSTALGCQQALLKKKTF